jgi:hypothetical protein
MHPLWLQGEGLRVEGYRQVRAALARRHLRGLPAIRSPTDAQVSPTPERQRRRDTRRVVCRRE